MVGWHHRLNGPEFQQTLGDGEGHVLQSMGSQRAGHDLVTEQQHSIYETCKDTFDLSITCTELGDLLFITWRVSYYLERQGPRGGLELF